MTYKIPIEPSMQTLSNLKLVLEILNEKGKQLPKNLNDALFCNGKLKGNTYPIIQRAKKIGVLAKLIGIEKRLFQKDLYFITESGKEFLERAKTQELMSCWKEIVAKTKNVGL